MIVQWRKSSYSGGVDDKACVELGRFEQGVSIRDSKDPEGGHLTLTSVQFGALVARIKRHQVR